MSRAGVTIAQDVSLSGKMPSCSLTLTGSTSLRIGRGGGDFALFSWPGSWPDLGPRTLPLTFPALLLFPPLSLPFRLRARSSLPLVSSPLSSLLSLPPGMRASTRRRCQASPLSVLVAAPRFSLHRIGFRTTTDTACAEFKKRILPVLFSFATSTHSCPASILRVSTPVDLAMPRQLARLSAETFRSQETRILWPAEIPPKLKMFLSVRISLVTVRTPGLGAFGFVFFWILELGCLRLFTVICISRTLLGSAGRISSMRHRHAGPSVLTRLAGTAAARACGGRTTFSLPRLPLTCCGDGVCSLDGKYLSQGSCTLG